MRAPSILFPRYDSRQDGNANSQDMWQRRQMAITEVRTRGTAQPPDPPRDIIVQSSPRAIKLNWALPAKGGDDIAGYKIYYPGTAQVYDTVNGKSVRTYQLPVSAGSTPPTVNGGLTSFNDLGIESGMTFWQGSALTEAGAPAQPSNPAGWSSAGGSDTTDTSSDVTPTFGR